MPIFFVFLVGIGFAFAILMSFVPWDLYVTCFQNGMTPDIASSEKMCRVGCQRHLVEKDKF